MYVRIKETTFIKFYEHMYPVMVERTKVAMGIKLRKLAA